MAAIPLSQVTWSSLNWRHPFSYPGLMRGSTKEDGSCLFHAIAGSYYLPYLQGNDNGVPIDKDKFIRNLRNDLASKLAEPISFGPGFESPSYYDLLGGGTIKELSKDNPEFSLETLQEELRSGRSVSYLYNELISNLLDIDIYFLDFTTRDVYVFENDIGVIYKSRPSIVILSLRYPEHFERIGIQTNAGITTFFDPKHDFIQSIRRRINEKISAGSGRLPT